MRAAIADLNSSREVTGYIIQLPLPVGHDDNAMLELIDPAKDADGLHPTNLGRLVLGIEGGTLNSPLPCTPAGIVELLRRYDVPIVGAHGGSSRPRPDGRPSARAPADPARGDGRASVRYRANAAQ